MVDVSPTASSTATSSNSNSESKPLCKICNARDAIYTCPRCKIKTCSLPCSSNHKSSTGCSGERNKVEFVNMRDYSWGTLMSDYTYLEDVGRKITDWGATIVKGMRGGRGRGGGGGARTKRDILKTQLEMQDISIDLLPLGMERRQHNQSMWDFKNQTAHLTIEFKFHPPHDPTTSKQRPSFTFLTHRNNTKTSLLQLVANQIRDRRNLEQKREKGKGKQKSASEDLSSSSSLFPSWILDLIEEISTPISNSNDPNESTYSPFNALIRAPILPTSITITGTRPKTAYHRISPTEPLLTALRKTHFVEYPTLELWPRGEFSGVVVDQHADPQASESSGYGYRQQMVFERGDLPLEDNDGMKAARRAKRRKIELKAGKKAISGLLQGYGSGDESEQDEEKDAGKDDGRIPNGMTMLDGYADSEDEDEKNENKLALESDEDDEEIEVSPEVLLELVRKAQGRSSWMDDSKDDERVDWGDEDSEDGEDEGEQKVQA
ncbi:hypothetical protein EV361DRAFT_1023783 [Lentinula raphanica]|uniref:HIT-type domain-containing protein n=1 Tax=Lentinula raphanica TaxID=153919 RepID=A0AA38UJI5_9AGAR|nr:hypothetical protein F5880DRAFT_1622409 [Lentinula raphanica]KAJ3840752.1 hypothetical protein F5878DRAFT_673013 [Lentinula raphanica]KAJ3977522.1 hypothetical protein EV361DRAFT_1023783 [Lentinula raphanica]